MNTRPSAGFAAAPPQPPPPSDPGNTRLGTIPYGVYGPLLTDLSKISVQNFVASGEILLTSLRVMPSRGRVAGFGVHGGVVHVWSPGAAKRGAGRSSTGKSGSPVMRLNMKSMPTFVICATAG